MANYIHIDQVKESRLFYMFPKWLLGPDYKKLSDRSKLFYMYFWDRVSLSEDNKWYDSEGRVYIYSTIDELKNVFGCSNQTVVNSKKELSSIGLIEEVRQGINKPNRIYVLGSLKSGILKSRTQEFQNLETINTEYINTEYINTDSSRLNNSTAVGGAVAEDSSLIRETEQEPDGQQHQQSIYDEIQENFGRVLWPIEIETLNHLLAENDIELVREALKRAVLNGKPSINYMDGILRSWRMKNITTPLEAQAEMDNTRKKTGNSNPYMSEEEAKRMQEKYGF